MTTMIDYEKIFARDVFCILGLPFDAVTLSVAADRVSDAIAKKEKMFLSTPNLNWLRMASANAEFRSSALLSDLSVADGMPVVWIARMLSVPITQRVSGSDLIDELARNSRMKVFFFGGEENNAEVAVNRLNDRSLPMRAVGGINPGHGNVEEMSSQHILENINSQSPDFVIVSLGAIKGQAWIVRNRLALNATVFSHLGAVVNFFAGSVSRAPKIFQRLGLEWLWRIIQEPKLASRYADDAVFLAKQLLTRLISLKFLQMTTASRVRNAPAEIKISASALTTHLELGGSFCAENMGGVRNAFTKAMRLQLPIIIDMQKCVYLDAMFVGMLLLLKKCCMESGLSLSIVGVDRHLRKIFFCLNAEYLLDEVHNAGPV